MENMEAKIKEVQEYFKNKLLSSEFEVAKIQECTIDLLVDSNYLFVIWTGNLDIPTTTQNYSNTLSFMDLEFTKDESIQLSKLMRPIVLKYKKDVLIEEKKQELEKLLNEIQ